jgi:HSP20 family molecular chaperone IbpA
VAVPFPVDVNEIRATLDKGALMVFLPKRRGHCTQQMRIPIEKI